MLMMTIIRVLEGERAGRVTNFIDVIFFLKLFGRAAELIRISMLDFCSIRWAVKF